MVRGTVFCVGAYIFMKNKTICSECKSEFTYRNHGSYIPACCSKKCSYEFRKYKAIIGEVCNQITVIRELSPNEYPFYGINKYVRFAECKCTCGNICKVELTRIRKKKVISCGCYKNPVPNNIRHGQSRTALYKVWNGMRQRCENPNVKCYKNYGGRGVTVCKEWLTFEPFHEWCTSNGWVKGLHIDKDKIGNGLLYSPETCCIITQKENNSYVRKRKGYTHNKRNI